MTGSKILAERVEVTGGPWSPRWMPKGGSRNAANSDMHSRQPHGKKITRLLPLLGMILFPTQRPGLGPVCPFWWLRPQLRFCFVFYIFLSTTASQQQCPPLIHTENKHLMSSTLSTSSYCTWDKRAQLFLCQPPDLLQMLLHMEPRLVENCLTLFSWLRAKVKPMLLVHFTVTWESAWLTAVSCRGGNSVLWLCCCCCWTLAPNDIIRAGNVGFNSFVHHSDQCWYITAIGYSVVLNVQNKH